MNIALLGYGKMGQAIESLGKDQGHFFPLIIDLENSRDLNRENLEEIDVAIEFTIPASAPDNIRTCIDNKIPVVCGTTGWNDRFGEIEDYCKKNQGTLFYASNFSIGVNILIALNDRLARIMSNFTSYEVSLEEVHHIHKLDSPSGTAITLAEQIIERQRHVKRWSLEVDDDPTTMHIKAVRKGEVRGHHTVRYDSEVDSLFNKSRCKIQGCLRCRCSVGSCIFKGENRNFRNGRSP